MKLYYAVIGASVLMASLNAQITSLEQAVEIIEHFDTLKDAGTLDNNAQDVVEALNALKKYIMEEDSLTQEHMELLLEKVADLAANSPLTRKKLKSKRFDCLLARNLTVCNDTTLKGPLSLQASNGNSITLQPCPSTTNYTLILPCDPGVAGQVLVTNGATSDQTSWITVSSLLSGTSADIPLTLVLRDDTGSFAATTVTLTGCLVLTDSLGDIAATICANTNALIVAPQGDRALQVTSAGNTRGINAVDLQLGGFASPTQVASGDYSFIAGGYYNTASGGISSIIGSEICTASSGISSIIGSVGCTASADQSCIINSAASTASEIQSCVINSEVCAASGDFSTVIDGVNSTASGSNSIIISASNATASGNGSTILGCFDATASGFGSIVVGGQFNQANGDLSFAAGNSAVATHTGAFVWADSQSDFETTSISFTSTANNTFSVRATNGARFVTAINGSGTPTAGVIINAGGSAWSSLSDKTKKTNYQEIDAIAVLEKVAHMPVETWSYKTEGLDVRHMGPYAQDFYELFKLGDDALRISTIDADGVALAAIKGMYELHLKDKLNMQQQIDQLKDMVRQLTAVQ